MFEDTIRDFVDGEYRQVVAAVDLVCGSRPTAEDAVQEALARAWERQARGEEIRSIPAWVTTVALNLARSHLRRRRCERRAVDRLGTITRFERPDHATSSSNANSVRAAVATLPRRQREVIVLRYYADLDVLEIAEVLGIAEGTVKASLHRGRKNLANVLADPEPEQVRDATP